MKELPRSARVPTRTTSVSRLLLFAIALFGFEPRSHPAQSPPATNPSTALTIYARTVVEHVVVMDKGGHAVPGLHKEDFHVFENGKPQSVTFFEPNVLNPEATVQPSIPPLNTFTNIPIENPHSVTNVLLLDALDSWPEDQMYAHVQMVKYLASLPPHLRIGIFTLDPEKLNLIWPLNQDSSALREAVAKFNSKPTASSTAVQRQVLLTSLNEATQQTQDAHLIHSVDALQKFLKYGPGIIQQHNHGVMNALQALATTWPESPAERTSSGSSAISRIALRSMSVLEPSTRSQRLAYLCIPSTLTA